MGLRLTQRVGLRVLRHLTSSVTLHMSVKEQCEHHKVGVEEQLCCTDQGLTQETVRQEIVQGTLQPHHWVLGLVWGASYQVFLELGECVSTTCYFPFVLKNLTVAQLLWYLDTRTVAAHRVPHCVCLYSGCEEATQERTQDPLLCFVG